MELERIILTMKKAGETFQRLDQTKKVTICCAGLLATAVVLSHVKFALVFVVALFGGGWAACHMTADSGQSGSGFDSGQLLHLLPDLVARLREKRQEAGLSVLPNFGADLERYSINRWKFVLKNTHENRVEISEGSGSGVALPVTVDEEFQHLVKSVMQDFVLSWYCVHVSDNGQVPKEFHRLLLSISDNICTRLDSVRKRSLFIQLMVEFRTHVFRYQRARSSLRKLRGVGQMIDSVSLVASYETLSLMHPAIEDTTTEVDYLKGIMRILFDSTTPRSVTECRASRAILIEILTCNLLLPLLNLLSDPDFLYRLILLILSSVVSLPETTKAPEKGPNSSETKKPVSAIARQGSVPHKDNIESTSVSESDQTLGCSRGDSSRGDSQHCHQTYHQESAMSAPSNQDLKDKTFQVDLKHSDFTKAPSMPGESSGTTCLPRSSRVSLTRSVDDLLAHSYPTMKRGSISNESLTSGSPTKPFSRRYHRSSSDSSFNPALSSFIPGDFVNRTGAPVPLDLKLAQAQGPSHLGLGDNPVDVPSNNRNQNPGEGHSSPGNSEGFVPSGEPCIPLEDIRDNDSQVVVPVTMLEPAKATEPVTRRANYSNIERPRSWSGNGASSSINYMHDISAFSMPFTDIGYQFLFDGSPASLTENTDAPEVLNAIDVRQPQVKKKVSRTLLQKVRSKSDNTSDVHVCEGVLQPEGTHTLKSRRDDGVVQDAKQPQSTVYDTITSNHQSSVVQPSSIQKLLRRVSLSKKGKPGSQKPEVASGAAKNPPLSTSWPVSIPASAQSPAHLPALGQNKSPPTLSQTNSKDDFVDDVQMSMAENHQTLSLSAPETSESSTDVANNLGKWQIMNLTVPKTEVCRDSGGKADFFLYSIQFDVLILPTLSSTQSLQGCDVKPVHKTTKRRHREFVNLHGRLEHNLLLKKSLKGIKDVPKRLSIPLAPTAKTAIDQRRTSHQNYLQQLLAKPSMHHSAELAKFLAIEGDTHIEYVRHQPREYVPRIDKLLRNRVSGIVDTVRSALPRALSDLGPLPPTSPTRKSRPSQDAGRKTTTSPSGSPRPDSPSSFDIQDDRMNQRRIFAFERRPKTTTQLAMNSIIQDHSQATSKPLADPTAATSPDYHHVAGPGTAGNDPKCPVVVGSEIWTEDRTSGGLPGPEEVNLFDAVVGLLGEAFHDKEAWFLDEGLQSLVRMLAGGLLDGWLERQIDLLLSEHWCAFYLAELREVLWPDGRLLTGNEEAGPRSVEEKEATRRTVLTALVDLMPDSFYHLVKKSDWQEGLQLLLDSLSDQHLNRHLVFMALDLLMDALIPEIKDESYQKDLLSRI